MDHPESSRVLGVWNSLGPLPERVRSSQKVQAWAASHLTWPGHRIQPLQGSAGPLRKFSLAMGISTPPTPPAYSRPHLTFYFLIILVCSQFQFIFSVCLTHSHPSRSSSRIISFMIHKRSICPSGKTDLCLQPQLCLSSRRFQHTPQMDPFCWLSPFQIPQREKSIGQSYLVTSY